MEIYIAVGAVALIVGLLLGTVIGSMHRKRVAEKEIGSAEEQAARIVEEAIKTAESKKKESVLEGKRGSSEDPHGCRERTQGAPQGSLPTGAPHSAKRRIA